MTTYYVDDRDILLSCAVESGVLTVTLLGTVYLDDGGATQATPPVVLTCQDGVDDVDDSDGLCTLGFATNPSGGWTLSFQRKTGATTWGADESTLEVSSDDDDVEWRVHAVRSGQAPLYSDPYIRVIKGQSSGF